MDRPAGVQLVNAETAIQSKLANRYSTVNWITFVAMTGFHVGAIAALFYFSWTAVLLTAVTYWMCIGLGIGMG